MHYYVLYYNILYSVLYRLHLESSHWIQHDTGRKGTNSQNDDTNGGNNGSSLFIGSFDINQGLADIVFGTGRLAFGDAVDPTSGVDLVVQEGIFTTVDTLGGQRTPALVGSNGFEVFRSCRTALDGESLGGCLRAGGPGQFNLVVRNDLDVEASSAELLCLGIHEKGALNTGLLVLALAAGLGLLLHHGLDFGLLFRCDVHPRSVFNSVGVSQVGSLLHLGDFFLGELLGFFLQGHVVDIGRGGIGGRRFFRGEKGGVHGKGADIHALLLDSSK
mmetsp:Transcript_9243/g.20059  ORF Transcript_9243/g.20059 Transcript_9243/m.20059 type:complete len:274 (-) Transcript_9243:127-948(-)